MPAEPASGARRLTRRLGTSGAAALLAAALLGCRAGPPRPAAPAGLSVPAGFTVERAAGPPLVERPIVADFDEAGRLYVAESSGSNDKVQRQLAERPHRILLLEDRNGDGRFDRRVVFADGMMLPEGAMWYRGSLYVAAPPSIWKLTDTDGDGVADRREEWFRGKTLTGCANDLHGPYLGLDGWIYWAKGAFGRQRYDRPGRPPLETRAAHVFRALPDGSGIEPVMTGGMDNPVDVVFTPDGEPICSATFLEHPQLGRRDGLIHAVYGGLFGKVHDVLDDPPHPRTGELLPALTHLGPAAPCGLTTYTSTVFGPAYRDNLFACLFNLHKVTRHELRPQGATYASRDSDFLVSTDPDFHPTDVLEDADGSLVVIDTGGWYKLCCPSSQLAKADVPGAIYRVRRIGAAPPADPRGRRIDWPALSPARLSGMLDDPRPAVRLRAIDRLGDLGDAAVGAVAAALDPMRSRDARRNAVWALARIRSAAGRTALRAALADPDESVRRAAIHGLALARDRDAVESLRAALAARSPAVRRAAAEALGRIGDPQSVPALLAAASEAPDRTLEHSVTYALIETADPAATAAGLGSPSPSARRAAAVALEQMPGGSLRAEQITPWLESADPALESTAWWIAARHPEWGATLAGALGRRLGAPRLEPADRDRLRDRLAGLARSPAIQELLAATATRGSTAARRTALSAMAAARLKELPGSWCGALARTLGEGKADLVEPALAAARSAPVPAAAAAPLAAALAGVARARDLPVELRTAALAARPGGPHEVDPEELALLRTAIGPGQPAGTRTLAAGVLGRAHLSGAALRDLVGAVEVAGPMELVQMLPAYRGIADEALAAALLGALERSHGRASLRPDIVRPIVAGCGEATRRRAEALLDTLDPDSSHQKAHLEDLESALGTGDVRRGQAIFNGQTAACSRCHAVGYLGGRVGPDLTRIGQIRTARDLLEAVVYPNASFARSYEPMVVTTRSGDEHSGVVRRDAPEEVVLQTSATDEVRIARGEIAAMRPGTVSVMPSGLEQQLSRQELADLIAFLQSRK